MSRRQQLERQRRSLDEVRDIMHSMKTLAYMETRKLARFLGAQEAMITSIETVANDFLSFHHSVIPPPTELTSVYLVIGSEQGFCGDFNQTLKQQLTHALTQHQNPKPMLVAVGHKLHGLLEPTTQVIARIDGASVVEEVSRVLNDIVSQLTTLQQQYGTLALSCLYHRNSTDICLQALLPPFQHPLKPDPVNRFPPELHEAPSDFFLALTEQYVFAALYMTLYRSLMVENHKRVTHLDSAVKHLEDKSETLRRQSSALRREEIIEEIEVILLNTSNLDDSSSPH